ncbi:MAG: sulfatase-like hydrolase/transferase [Sedimentisphaerales bacterium]|nr:sulfatase-like hydrolase/transferase [Sedimentisphaerales bacterium]
MQRRQFLKTIGYATAGLQLSLISPVYSNPKKRPNFLFIFTDDQGYGDMSAHGNQYLETPNLDQLAGEGVEFTQFHASPLCAPSRACLLTGRQFLRTGVWGVHRGHDYLNLDETTFAQVLRKAGYATGMMGKWHSGKPEAWRPWKRGFDESWIAHLYRHMECNVLHNGTKEKWQGWTTDLLTDKAIEFMEAKNDQPFFCYLAFLAPHAPWFVPPSYLKKYTDKGLNDPIATCFGMIDQIDHNVGRLMNALDQLGLADNTIVIFTSDNGPINEAEREWGKINEEDFQKRNPRGLRGRKGDIWENGTRVPCIVRWKDHYKPAKVDRVAHLVDMYPTFLDLAGVSVPAGNKPLDGKSLRPLWEGNVKDWPDRLVFNSKDEPYWPGKFNRNSILPDKSAIKYENQVLTVRNQQFKLVKNGDTELLFDIPNDPQEKNDVSEKHPQIKARLSQALKDWYAEILTSEDSYNQPRFPVGYPGDSEGYLYACAVTAAKGNVQGGSHSTTNWQDSGDAQTLLIDVLNPGPYRVGLDARVMNTDAVVEVSVDKAAVQGKVKPDGPIYLGTINLEKGPADLNIRLVQVTPGYHPVFQELRGIWLRKEEGFPEPALNF